MKRNLISLLGSVVLMASLASCTGAKEGNVVNIWCWNSEFQTIFNKFYPEVSKVDGNSTTLKDGKVVKFTIHSNDNNGYQIPLDEALKAQKNAKADDRIDMFLLEADYADKYVNSSYTMDVKDLGVTDSDTAQMYEYTKTIAKDSSNKLKALSWQATPGLYAYRNDIAKQIWADYPADPLDSDDAATKATKTAAQSAFVQEKLKNWNSFDTAAAAAKEKGFKMVSGYDDMYRVFSNNATTPWVKDKKVTIPSAIKDWLKKEKNYVDNDYSGTTTLWDTQWQADQGQSGKVLGFFYSTWGINFTLLGNSLADSKAEQKKGNGIFGEYRVCQGPASYYWGGTWMAACEGTDNKSTIKDIMLKLTCDKAIAKKMTQETQDYTNNKSAMNEIANDKTFGSAFLGGQNHIKLFTSTAEKINLAAITGYDQGCNEQFQNAMHDFLKKDEPISYDKAYENFKTALTKLYPALTFDDTANKMN